MKRLHKRILTAVLVIASIAVMVCPVIFSTDGGQTQRYTAAQHAAHTIGRVELPEDGVDVNNGNLEEIMRLKGVGEKIGQAVIDERTLHGPYFYPEDLLAVRGIGEKTLAGFRDILKLTDGE